MSKIVPAATSPEISARLAEVLSRHTLEEVVRMLNDVGYSTSVETVRRYREGLAQRIDSAFLAAVVAATGTDATWLLSGPGSPEDMTTQANSRAAHALHEIAMDAAAGYLGPRSPVAWQEEIRREMTKDFVFGLLHRLEIPLAEIGSHLRDWADLSELMNGDPEALELAIRKQIKQAGKNRPASVPNDDMAQPSGRDQVKESATNQGGLHTPHNGDTHSGPTEGNNRRASENPR